MSRNAGMMRYHNKLAPSQLSEMSVVSFAIHFSEFRRNYEADVKLQIALARAGR